MTMPSLDYEHAVAQYDFLEAKEKVRRNIIDTDDLSCDTKLVAVVLLDQCQIDVFSKHDLIAAPRDLKFLASRVTYDEVSLEQTEVLMDGCIRALDKKGFIRCIGDNWISFWPPRKKAEEPKSKPQARKRVTLIEDRPPYNQYMSHRARFRHRISTDDRLDRRYRGERIYAAELLRVTSYERWERTGFLVAEKLAKGLRGQSADERQSIERHLIAIGLIEATDGGKSVVFVDRYLKDQYWKDEEDA